MNVNVDKQPQCRVSMRVELSKEEVEAERKNVIEVFQKQARIPGYRPGKVPLPVVEKRYQKEISEELETRLVRRGCRDGIEQESLSVIAVTGIDQKTTHPDLSFSFVAEMQITPDFAIPTYEGIAVELAPVTVTEADVDQQMELLRQRESSFEPIQDRGLQTGDFAVLNFTASVDGQPLEEAVEGTGFLAQGKDEWVRMGPDSFIPGFCEALEGTAAGESKSFDLTVAEEFQMEALRGRTLHYEVTVNSALQQILPDWSDELAQVFGLENVASLREKCREHLLEQAKERREGDMTTQILEYLDKNVEFELPDRVLAYETQRQVNQIVTRIHQRGATEDQITGQKDAIIQHASTQAEVNVKTAFILRQIAQKENIQATQDELAAFCVSLARSAGISLKKYIRQLQKSDALEEITDRIVRMKTLQMLRDKAQITEAAPSTEPAAPESPPSAEGGAAE